MRALIRGDRGVELATLPPRAAGPDEVLVDVAFAGVCRSDLAVADGTIAVPAGRVIGHELAGWVGGAPVTVIPFTDCRSCVCTRGERCEQPRWLGVDRDGAFADQVVVPAHCVLPLPREMSLVLGAYVEPVAAALGVLPAIERHARVLVTGAGRIAELTARVVAAHGARVTRRLTQSAESSESGRSRAFAESWDVAESRAFDVVIEHSGVTPHLLAALRRGGTLVLKSRAARTIALDTGELVARDLTVRGASHGSFTAAIDWLHGRRILVDDLLAQPRALDDYAAVLATARSEERKQLFVLAGAR